MWYSGEMVMAAAESLSEDLPPAMAAQSSAWDNRPELPSPHL